MLALHCVCYDCVKLPMYELKTQIFCMSFYQLTRDELNELPYLLNHDAATYGTGANPCKIFLHSSVKSVAEAKYHDLRLYHVEQARLLQRMNPQPVLTQPTEVGLLFSSTNPAAALLRVRAPLHPETHGLLSVANFDTASHSIPILAKRFVGNDKIAVLIGGNMQKRLSFKKSSTKKQKQARCARCGEMRSRIMFSDSKWKHKTDQPGGLICTDCPGPKNVIR